MTRKDRVTPLMAEQVKARDDWSCRGPLIGMPGPCSMYLELDHVRASGGLSLRSKSEMGNLISLCSDHHRLKTEHGRTWRPLIIQYLDSDRDRCPVCREGEGA